MTLDSLISDNGHIVAACGAANDNLHRAVRLLQDQMLELRQDVTHMKESLEPLRCRMILDQARDLLHGEAISPALRGEAWNTRVEDNIETFLQRGAAAGLTVSDLRLTCFREGSSQQLGAKAANEAELKSIAIAAVAGGPGFQRLFLFVYGREAEAIVSGK
jgi:hypothetical protein